MADNQHIILGGVKPRYASVISALYSRINSFFLSLSLTYFIHQYLSLIPCLIKDLRKGCLLILGKYGKSKAKKRKH